MKNRRPLANFLREKHPDMHDTLVENPTCAYFDEYKEVPLTATLDFSEDDATLVASKLSGDAGALGSEAIELRNWLLRFLMHSRGVYSCCRRSG